MPRASATGVGPSMTWTLLFDADCPLCRNLAELSVRRVGPALHAVSWQTFCLSADAVAQLPAATRDRPADQLRVWTGQELVEGEGAWAFLLAQHPDLSALQWLAARLGLSAEVGRALMRSGALLRRLCRRCGRSLRRGAEG